MQLRDVIEVREINSTYVEGELHKKFVCFLENYDSMGLKADEVELDLGGNVLEGMEEEDIALEIPTEDSEKDVPSIWVLINDSSFPVFKPVFTTAKATDTDAALTQYGLDIIELKTEFTEVKRKLQIRFNGDRLEKFGSLRELQAFIIENFEFIETRAHLLEKLKEVFLETSAVSSFSLKIPAHRISTTLVIED